MTAHPATVHACSRGCCQPSLLRRLKWTEERSCNSRVPSWILKTWRRAHLPECNCNTTPSCAGHPSHPRSHHGVLPPPKPPPSFALLVLPSDKPCAKGRLLPKTQKSPPIPVDLQRLPGFGEVMSDADHTFCEESLLAPRRLIRRVKSMPHGRCPNQTPLCPIVE